MSFFYYGQCCFNVNEFFTGDQDMFKGTFYKNNQDFNRNPMG